MGDTKHPIKPPIGSVLVLGGGIAGMQAALDLASTGFLVHLVTDEPSIGGKMVRLDKTFPTNECAMCLLGPKMTDCQNHPNIRIYTRATLSSLEGEAGNFRATIRKAPRYVDIEECTACGECEAVCPVEVPNDFNQGMGNRKAIYKQFPQAVPNAYLIDKRGIAPCRQACPAGCDVQGYVALISRGKFKEALDTIRRTIPFPGICGRVCTHPCETACNRAQYDDPVAIRALKRAAADYGWSELPVPEVPRREEKVAIIGAGPAGLTAALELASRGYPVTVYESLPVAGGMMRVGIPAYRLPRHILEREIEEIRRAGVEIRLNSRVESLDKLFDEGYRAVLVATGAHRGARLGAEGENTLGVLEGVSFLRRVNLGEKVEIGPRVAVVGGGNVAMDVARTALRQGAGEVMVIYRRTRAEMPALPEEVKEAEEEGIKFLFLAAPKRITRQGQHLEVECLRMELGEPDASGRRRPVPVAGSEFTLVVDNLIAAVGQTSDLPEDWNLTASGRLQVDKDTLATNRPGVFAAGDLVSGPATVVEAIAGGRRAALSIDRYLRGEVLVAPAREKGEKLGPPENMPVPGGRRLEEEASPPAQRRQDFREVLQGYTLEQAMEEAGRCLNCGICSECLQCVLACKKNAIHHEAVEELEELEVGAVIAAPGFDLFDATLAGQYGYGLYPNVVTSIEFERLLSSTGPTRGEVARPSDGRHPRRIAFIQCVGSRDSACGAEYCSAICCMYSTKEAIIAREHDPEVESTIFFLDLRSYGKNFDRYVESARRDYGVRYVRSFISSVKEDPVTRNLSLRYYAEGELHEEEFDLVVLAIGVRPPRDARKLAGVLGIELNEYGFARTDEFSPTYSTRPGVLVAGAFQGPRDIPETVMNASAAAAAAASFLSAGRGQLVTPKVYPPEREVAGEEPRIGVFVCRCGINIAAVVDVPRVVEYASTLPGVVHAEETVYTCSQDSLKNIRGVIQEKRLNRVVVASCTIRTHQPLFREALREAGLNQFLFEMANIRDQCSWVHKASPDEATEKARDLVRMAVAKVKQHEPLHLHPVPVVQKALVIGGGIAGMTASLALAERGYETFLVEREDTLGGNLRRLRYTMDGRAWQDFLTSTVHQVHENPLIHVYTNARVEGFSGHAGHFTTTVKVQRGGEARTVQLDHGVVIVATGSREHVPAEYLYGQNPRVMTALELEDRLWNDAPEIGGWSQVAMILCVGSRDEERRYCSRTCCGQSVKNALLLKQRNPRAEVYVLYRDMRTYSFLERYYQEAREKGVVFLPFADGTRPEVREGEGGRLEIAVTDQSTGLRVTMEVDALVLATGAVAPEGTSQLGTMLKVPTQDDGFFLETHIKLAPMDFPSQGLFLCGSVHSPKFASEAIYQAEGAVARACTILSQTKLMAGGVVAMVDDSKCAACLTCVRVCPYSVPFINERNVAEINPVQCHGCGVCVAECPNRAIQLQHYRDEQLLAKIRGAFKEVV
mgnify:CR=1 FL=1